jgi:hypothetical protein
MSRRVDENPVDPLTGLPIDPKKPPTSAPQLPPPAANANALAQQQVKRVGDALIAHRGLRRVRVTASKAYQARKKALEDLRERIGAKDAQPRSLYIRRDVLNGDEILRHYKKQGLENLRAASDLHVTIMYSREPVDWMKVGSDDWGGTTRRAI